MSSEKSPYGRGKRVQLTQTRFGKGRERDLPPPKVLPPDPHFDQLVKQWNEAMTPTEIA